MSVRSGTAPPSVEPAPPAAPEPRRMRVGPVVLASLAAGFAAAGILPFLPARRGGGSFATAMDLFGLAVGWARWAVLSTRSTDQPQRWALVPAVVMAVAAVLLPVA